MKALIAITHHNLDFVANAVQPYLQRNKDVLLKTMDIDGKLPGPTKKKAILLIPTVATVKANATVLNKCPNVVVLVFDAPLMCVELKNAKMLDVEKNTPSYVFKFRRLAPHDVSHAVSAAFRNEENQKLDTKVLDVGMRLLKRTRGSVVSKFITFMYKIPNTNRRNQVQATLFDFIWRGKINDAKAYIKKNYSNTQAENLVLFFDTEDARAFFKAIEHVRTKPRKSYAELAKHYHVNKFDLTYFMRFWNDLKKEKANEDD
jgi:hypothetical protein